METEDLEMMKGTLCEKCKFFYDLHISFDGWHNCCSKEMCYLCNNDYCPEYQKGEVPEEKIRGKWE